ncbi:MAG: hypothetical protein N2319_04720 [Candidatus Kapabacteria bacterium]|nr:hypothetical protein [Candidatus Kapabacteria bacterium]
MVLNKDFREFIKFLNENDVKYLVVGGYAVAYYGHPRYTKDFDIWIEISEENSLKMLKKLKDFGFGSLNITKDDFLNPQLIIQLGNPPNKINIINSYDGVEFDYCFKNKQIILYDDLKINFIGLDDLKQNKKATGRLQDLADLEKLTSGSDLT